MLKKTIQSYIDAACDDMDIGVAVYSIESGEEIAVSYDVVADTNVHGGLMIIISIEMPPCGEVPF